MAETFTLPNNSWSAIGGASFFLTGDENGITITLNDDGALSVSGLNEGSTLGGSLDDLSSINGITFGVTETAANGKATLLGQEVTKLGGDGAFSVVAGASGISEIIGLGGKVSITDLGGASILRSNDAVRLVVGSNGAIHTFGDSAVDFNISDGKIASVSDFGGSGMAAVIEGNLNGLTIDGDLINVTGDGNDKIVYKSGIGMNGEATEGFSLVGIDDSKGTGVSINGVGAADVVQTSGDGEYTFFGSQSFAISGESVARSTNADVWYKIENNQVTEISGLNENSSIEGAIGAIKVNGIDLEIEEGDVIVGLADGTATIHRYRYGHRY